MRLCKKLSLLRMWVKICYIHVCASSVPLAQRLADTCSAPRDPILEYRTNTSTLLVDYTVIIDGSISAYVLLIYGL